MSGPRPTAQADRAHRFGASPPLSLGVEEELLLVDAELALATCAEAVMESVPEAAAGRVSTEIFSEQIEVKTGVCLGAEEALGQLRETRGQVASAGFRMLASGLHPAATGRVRLVSNPRYQVVKEDLGEIILSTPPCGLHVHVGIPDPEAAVRIANAFRRYLPALTALSANSPFRRGADSGHASARTTVVRAYPRFQVPRAFRDYEDFCRVADELIAAAGVDDYTYIWWDVRPHPKLGTVEVRALDVQADAATSVALAALIQALAARELERPSDAGHAREALEESYFQAASHGLAARILLDDDSPEPAPQVARQVLDAARPTPASSAPTPPSRSSSGSCARATGPTSSAASTPPAGCAGCSSISTPAPADARHGARRGRLSEPGLPNPGIPFPRRPAGAGRRPRKEPSMAETVGAFVLRRLHEHGVDRIYGYPGDGINGVLGGFDRARRRDRVRPDPPRGDGRLHGLRPRQVHRRGRRLPRDLGPGRDPPAQRPLRREARPPAGRRDRRPAGAQPRSAATTSRRST